MWIGTTIVIILILVLGPLVLADPVFAEEKVPEKYVPDRLLIKFKKEVSNSEKDKLLKENGASILSEIKQIDVKILKVPENALEKVQAAFAKNAKVEYVEKDFILEVASIPNDPKFSSQWHLQKLKVPEAWNIGGSNPVTIAILDTGIAPDHPDLIGKFVAGYNFFDNNEDWSAVCTHGTAVAGSSTAITNNAIGIAGLAPNAKIMPIRISDVPPSCGGSYSAMAKGLVFAADNGARVANISFRIYDGSVLTDAAKYMFDKGGWVVAAAGNDGNFIDKQDNPYIISVAAVKTLDEWAGSTYGPFVDFTAPGVSIYTTFPPEYGYYGSASGTSFSSPIVAGTIALLMATNPDLTPSQIYNILKNSAVDLGSAGRDNYYGWGRVDAYGALLQNNPTPSPPDTTAPGTPLLLAPANSALINDNTPSFDWSDVTDASLPVTYTLLGDNSNDFSSPEISKQSLLSSDYTSLISLADGTYYWKVRAADGAGNIGSYSPARTVIIDTTLPSVSITNPQNGADVTAAFTISVASSDNVAVNRVELYVDGVFFGQKTSLPYDFSLDANAMSTGTHEIKAVSIDSSGNSNFAKITINVVRNSSDIIPPNVSITNPSDGAVVSGMITVSTSATDNVAVSSVELYLNNVLYNKKTTSPYDFSVDTKNLPSGSNTLIAKALDSSNNSNEDTANISVQANTLPPSIAITNPANGAQVTGKVTITAQPSNFASTPTVKFFIDGALKATDSSAPYEYGWQTKGASSGAHTITVDAADTNSNKASASISVQIPAKGGKPVPTGIAQTTSPQETDFPVGLEEIEYSSEIVKNSLIETSEFDEQSILSSEVPFFDPILPQSVAEGDSLSIKISFSDPDGDDLTFVEEDQIIPPFCQLTDNGDGTATLGITPGFEGAGDYTLTIIAKDNGEPPPSSSITILLTVTESTPDSVISYLQNQKSSLSSEDIKNLDEKVSYAAQLHKYLVDATKQKRSEFQALFHSYTNDAKGLLQIGQGAEQKMILQDISKTQLKLDNVFEKLNIQEENEDKAKDVKLLREKKQELTDTINQIIAVEHFIKRGAEKEKQIEELSAKKLVLMKEVVIEEARQSNVDLTEDDIKKIEEKIEKSSQSSAGQDNGNDKASNGNGNGVNNNGNGNGGNNNSNKGSSSDKGNNGNKGGNDNPKKN